MVNERTFVSSAKLRWALDDFTPGTDIGPVMCGLAHSDYTAAEIEEWIENAGSWNEGDLVNQEIAKRKIKLVGIFGEPGSGAGNIAVLNDGKAITTKLGWILLQGQTLDLWAYNMGTAAIATTVPQCHIEGHCNLWPQ